MGPHLFSLQEVLGTRLLVADEEDSSRWMGQWNTSPLLLQAPGELWGRAPESPISSPRRRPSAARRRSGDACTADLEALLSGRGTHGAGRLREPLQPLLGYGNGAERPAPARRSPDRPRRGRGGSCCWSGRLPRSPAATRSEPHTQGAPVLLASSPPGLPPPLPQAASQDLRPERLFSPKCLSEGCSSRFFLGEEPKSRRPESTLARPRCSREHLPLLHGPPPSSLSQRPAVDGIPTFP